MRCHDHTPQAGQHQFPKNFIVSSGKMVSVSVGHLAWRRETGGGAGIRPLQKSKAFIKNAINRYQKKTHGRLEEEAEREAGRQRRREGPKPSTANNWLGGRCEGSWDGDTKCITVPPQTAPGGGGGRGCSLGRGGLSSLLAGDPTGTGTA